MTSPDPAARVDMIGYGAAIMGAALFSTKAIMIKLAYAENATPEALLALRMGLALPLYIVLGWLALRRRRREGRASPPWLVGVAALNGLLGYYCASFFDFSGLQHITAQLGRLILFTYPFFVVLFGAAFFGRPMKPRAFPALVIAYTGIGVVFARSVELDGAAHIWLGSLLVLGAAISFALFQLLGREIIDRMGGAGLYTAAAMISAGLGVLTHVALVDPMAPFVQTPPVYVLAVGLAVLATVVPSYLMNFALGRVGADGTAMVGNAGPIFTIALSAAILGEAFGLWEALGAALVIIGMIYFARGDKA